MWLFLIGNGAEIRPLEMGRKGPGAVICDFQQCGILTSVDSDEPGEPLVKLRNSK